MNTYSVGQAVRLTAAFTNIAGAAADPTAVTCLVRSTKNGLTTTYVVAAGQIVKDSVGNYHLDVTVTSEGDGYWFYRWVGTGAITAAGDGTFGVLNSVFA
jgi:hypothetical protein